MVFDVGCSGSDTPPGSCCLLFGFLENVQKTEIAGLRIRGFRDSVFRFGPVGPVLGRSGRSTRVLGRIWHALAWICWCLVHLSRYALYAYTAVVSVCLL